MGILVSTELIHRTKIILDWISVGWKIRVTLVNIGKVVLMLITLTSKEQVEINNKKGGILCEVEKRGTGW